MARRAALRRGFTVTPAMMASAQAAGTRASPVMASLVKQRMALVSALAQREEAAIKQEPGRVRFILLLLFNAAAVEAAPT